MMCPKCDGLTTVIDSVVIEKSYYDDGARILASGCVVRRRRECTECGHRFTTLEKIVERKKKK